MTTNKSNLPAGSLTGPLLLMIMAMAATNVSAQSAPSSKTLPPGHIGKARDGIVYGISGGETLSSISQRFTGTPKYWAVIGKANGIANDRTIPVGTAIAIPARLLPDKNAFATIVAVQGEISIVSKDGEIVAAKPGEQLTEGTLIATSDEGFITLQLKDGTTFALPPASNLQLSKLRIQEYTDRPRTALTLQKGRVTSLVTPFSAPKSQYEVQTPLAIAGVRGTRFRINFDGSRSYSEVLEGTVKVAPEHAAPAQTRSVTASYGAIVGGGGKKTVSGLIPLLAPPRLDNARPLQERLPLRFALTQPEASAFRVAVSTDDKGLRKVAEVRVDNDGAAGSTTSATQVRIAELDDGDYYAHVSAIDRNGLEGKEATYRFRLKARPFPPFQQAPDAKVRGAADGPPAVHFQWADVGAGNRYHLQIAADAGFTQLLADRNDLAGTEFTQSPMTPGSFFWRIGTVATKDGKPDPGPWSDARQFQVLPPQKAPSASQDQNAMHFAWDGEAGQRFVFETSADAGFGTVLLHLETAEPHAQFALPPAGVYYARLQSIDADGYRGAFSPAQKFVVERRWSTGSGGAVTADGVPVRGD